MKSYLLNVVAVVLLCVTICAQSEVLSLVCAVLFLVCLHHSGTVDIIAELKKDN